MSGVVVREAPWSFLAQYAGIPNGFEATTVFDVAGERTRDDVFRKDYDALESPLQWPLQFDVSRWGLLAAWQGESHIGGAIVAFDTPRVDMLEGRRDLAVVWDIRVARAFQRSGVGTALMNEATRWARHRGCTQLKVETQDTNPAACRFYQRQGFALGAVNRGAYPGLPDETQLLWYKSVDA